MLQERQDRRFLVCSACGTCCLLSGAVACEIAADPPACAGCGITMAVCDTPPPLRPRFARAS